MNNLLSKRIQVFVFMLDLTLTRSIDIFVEALVVWISKYVT